jgi:hypothetical protein
MKIHLKKGRAHVTETNRQDLLTETIRNKYSA